MKIKDFFTEYQSVNTATHKTVKANWEAEILAYSIYDDKTYFKSAVIFKRKDGKLGGLMNGVSHSADSVWDHIQRMRFRSKVFDKALIEKSLDTDRFIKRL